MASAWGRSMRRRPDLRVSDLRGKQMEGECSVGDLPTLDQMKKSRELWERLGKMEYVGPEEGEVVVVHCSEAMPVDQIDAMVEGLGGIFPRNEVLVLGPGHDLILQKIAEERLSPEEIVAREAYHSACVAVSEELAAMMRIADPADRGIGPKDCGELDGERLRELLVEAESTGREFELVQERAQRGGA